MPRRYVHFSLKDRHKVARWRDAKWSWKSPHASADTAPRSTAS